MIGVFYGFQLVPDVRQVTPCAENQAAVAGDQCGWSGWFLEKAQPLIQQGYRLHHLHNPFGLYDLLDRKMHVAQFYLAHSIGLDWLADRSGFISAVESAHQIGGRVHAYIGSPLAIPEPRLAGRAGRRCLTWERRILRYVDVLTGADVDAIGFDSSVHFTAGDCMYRLIEKLLANDIEVIIEPWPRCGHVYPPVSWILRELLYQRIKHNPRADELEVDEAQGRIYRILPAHDTEPGRAEIQEINRLSGSNYSHTQELVQSAHSDGHIPLVRVHQLLSGSVT